MELHPFLERGQRPGLDLWYVAGQTDQSDAPSQRVGQTMTYVPRLREVNEGRTHSPRCSTLYRYIYYYLTTLGRAII